MAGRRSGPVVFVGADIFVLVVLVTVPDFVVQWDYDYDHIVLYAIENVALLMDVHGRRENECAADALLDNIGLSAYSSTANYMGKGGIPKDLAGRLGKKVLPWVMYADTANTARKMFNCY